eukprot:5843068-Heterocapsa_arctica.AAC.1
MPPRTMSTRASPMPSTGKETPKPMRWLTEELPGRSTLGPSSWRISTARSRTSTSSSSAESTRS